MGVLKYDIGNYAGQRQQDRCCHNPINCILPPYILERLSESPDESIRNQAIKARELAAATRTRRMLTQLRPTAMAIHHPAARKNRLVYDANGSESEADFTESLIRSEGDDPVSDAAVNEAYDNSGNVWDFFWNVFSRNSINDFGMTLVSTVHVGTSYNNAFWNGSLMAYGDGDGSLFLRFTKSLDVAGHEITHGVVMSTCDLTYYAQSGALNEHFADVFGALVAQWKSNTDADVSDWTIGADIMGPDTTANCLRTFKNEPAFKDDPILGDDPQPKHMDDYYTGYDDHRGVHINSGIPNHAFYLFALALGGKSWEKAGKVWYDTLPRLSRDSDFADMVQQTVDVAENLYGESSSEVESLNSAWRGVGL